MINLSVVTPDKAIFLDKVVDEVIMPGYEGEMNILSGHSPVLTSFVAGVLKYREKNTNEFQVMAISWGHIEVFPGGINVLAETAEMAHEIDLSQAIESQKEAEKNLVDPHISEHDAKMLTRRIARSISRQEAAKTVKK